MQDRSLIILYGSQTGTAEDVAKRLRKQAKQRHFITSFSTMNDFPVEKLPETACPVIFVCSTTGQGEEPDNMKVFWRALLRRRLPPNSLSTLQFAVLGLGDSSYQYFNFPAKRLHKRLLRLGATALQDLGLADDQHELGIDGVVEPWTGKLFDLLMEKYPLPSGVSLGDSGGPPLASYQVDILDAAPEQKEETTMEKNDFAAVLIENRRVTADDHFQDVRFIRFDVGKNAHYVPGDVTNLIPENSDEAVIKLLDFFGLNKESFVRLSLCDEDATLPPQSRLANPSSIWRIAKKYWDFQAVPRKSFFELLAALAEDSREKERLKEFASPEGTDELYKYCFRAKRTSFEVLQDFPLTAQRIPLNYLFDLFHPIQPRSFSIASSPTHHAGEIHLLVAVVRYHTNLKKPRIGLCSNWLASLPLGTTVNACIKKGSMKFDKAEERPVVMVGPGTGLAPFRSFIYERSSRNIRNSILFFGFRHIEKDFYFKDEWDVLIQKDLLTLHKAVSRAQEQKVYVQHVMRQFGEAVCDALVDQGGYFFLAGNSKNMPTEVSNAIKDIFSEHGKMSSDEADAYVKEMIKDGRYQTETWS